MDQSFNLVKADALEVIGHTIDKCGPYADAVARIFCDIGSGVFHAADEGWLPTALDVLTRVADELHGELSLPDALAAAGAALARAAQVAARHDSNREGAALLTAQEDRDESAVHDKSMDHPSHPPALALSAASL
jgi:hypothetical protein